MKISEVVRKQARLFFRAAKADEVLAEFETADLPLIANNGERVLLAILLLSSGDMNKFRRALQQARQDWRETLVAAELANDDWPATLRSKGIEIPG